MNLADVFTFLFVILGFIIVYVGYWLFAFALFPAHTGRCALRLGATPVKATLLGAVTLVPLVAVGLWISSVAPNGLLKIIGLAVSLVAMLLALFGSAGLALRIGQGLASPADEQQPWRRVLRGGIVLSLTFVMPFLGTFVIMPLTFVAGFGAFLLARSPRAAAVLAPALAAASPVTPPPMPTAAL